MQNAHTACRPGRFPAARPAFAAILTLLATVLILPHRALAQNAPRSAPPELLEWTNAAPIAWDSAAQSLYVTAAAVDPSGMLWVGTEEAGVWRCDPKAAKWTGFSTKDGLGDDSIFAMAADRHGRIWVGHRNHGVSVYNGQAWRNYDVAAGPIGQHIFTIAVCPADGDVWIATDAGISRYSDKQDTWSSLTRADGLPSDQIQSIAFDRDGNAFVGTQCDGIAMANAAGGYKTWRTVRGPDRLPTEPIGDGLPTSCINQVLVARDGVVWAATTAGLARSGDHGKTWRFMRGADWAAKVQGRTGGPPAGWKPQESLTLVEDYVTSIAEDEVGLLWVAYSRKGYECLDARTDELTPMGAGKEPPALVRYITTILAAPGHAPFIGTYGAGLKQAERWYQADQPKPAAPAVAAAAPAPLPSPVKLPTATAFDAMLARLRQAKPEPLTAACLGEDWATEGDWVGRYGRELMRMAWYGTTGFAQGYQITESTGPHTAGTGRPLPYTYYATVDSKDPRALYYPMRGRRMIGEWNDGSFNEKLYGPTYEGPDLWFDLTVPQGVHRLTLYFINHDAREADRCTRDFLIEIKPHDPDKAKADFAPALARSRVRNHYLGVYKQFLVAQGHYWVKLNRNYSPCAKVNAVFLDQFPPGPVDPRRPSVPGITEYRMPALPQPPELGSPNASAIGAAMDLWNKLDVNADDAALVGMQRAYRLIAFRLAADCNADKDLLANWRWRLLLWNDVDRQGFAAAMADNYDRFIDNNPHVATSAFSQAINSTTSAMGREARAGGVKPMALPAALPADPDELKALVAEYLVRKNGKGFGSHGFPTQSMNPQYYIEFWSNLKLTTPESAPERIASLLTTCEGLAQIKKEQARRRLLAVGIAAQRMAVEDMKDDWLAARIYETELLPHWKFANGEDACTISPIDIHAPAALAYLRLHDTKSMLRACKLALEDKTSTSTANTQRIQLAQALYDLEQYSEARQLIQAIPPADRPPDSEAAKLLRQIEAKMK